MPAKYTRGPFTDFNSARKLKETLAWIVLSVAIIIIGIFAVQVMVKPEAKKSKSSKEPSQTEQKTKDKKSEEQKKKEESPKEEPKGIGKIRVVVDGLNMRSTPEKRTDNRIASLPVGTELTVLSKTSNWYEVVNKDGVKGYVSAGSRYVEAINMEQ